MVLAYSAGLKFRDLTKKKTLKGTKFRYDRQSTNFYQKTVSLRMGTCTIKFSMA